MRKKIPRKVRSPKKVMHCTIYGGVTGIVVGTVGALFQIGIEWMINKNHSIFHLLSGHLILQWLFSICFSTLFLVVPLLIVRNFVPEAAGSGVHEIEGVLEDKRSMCWRRVLPAKFIGGIMSLSSGLVLGREGPTIQMGGAVGQFVCRLFRLNTEYAHILVAAGAGAGLSTAFNAPLAGILFVLEEMRHQFKFSFKSFQTVMIACVVADVMLQIILQGNGYDIRKMMDIDMTTYNAPPLSSLWLFVIFGAVFGVLGVFFNKFLLSSLNFFARRSGINFWKWIILIGVSAGILVMVFPRITGGGYAVIPEALHGNLGLLMLIIICVSRFVTTLASYGTGVPGGIFAPMIALGTIFGMIFGVVAHFFFPGLIPDPQVFAVAGMSALFTATVSAPLTGIVLVVEMTMNYALILPLILTCFSAAIAAAFMNSQPIYSTLLSRTMVLAKKRDLYLNNAGTLVPFHIRKIFMRR